MKDIVSRTLTAQELGGFHEGWSMDVWKFFGCHQTEDGAYRFAVWAPNAKSVTLVGEFNNWDRAADPMQRLSDGTWVLVKEGLEHSALYKYCVLGADGKERLKTDPFATHCETGPATASRVWPIDDYRWGDRDYLYKRGKKNIFRSAMSIYELHLGSWKRTQEGYVMNYRQIADELAAYCVDMGYTHVELLPVTEYPFEGSWGYQVTGYFAPTSRYGTPQDFMYLVDRLHQAGVGVIIDWVPAHFPRDEHGLARFDGTLLYECKEERMASHPEWGTLIFDYEMPEVQSFLISSAALFFDKYHIDGIRVDAVSSMLYLNYGRKDGEWTPNREGGSTNLGAVDFLRRLNTTILTHFPGAMTIAEESSAYPSVTKPPYDGGLGFSFKWDMGYMHDTLDYFSMNSYFRSKNHNKLTFSMMYTFSENFILAYSHDEVVHGKKSMVDKMFGSYEEKFATLRALYGYQFAHPGKKLTFMGSEFGQFIEWNYKQGLDWLLLLYPMHKAMQDYCRALNEFYTAHRALWDVDDSWDGFQWLNVNDSDRSSIAFLRTSRNGHRVICACNFTPVGNDDFVIGLPRKGVLREVLNSDDKRFGGSGVHNEPEIRSRDEGFYEHPFSAHLKLPPLSAVYFTFTAR